MKHDEEMIIICLMDLEAQKYGEVYRKLGKKQAILSTNRLICVELERPLMCWYVEGDCDICPQDKACNAFRDDGWDDLEEEMRELL